MTDTYPAATRPTELQFDTPPLESQPQYIVGHWTGGERGAAPIYRVLVSRGCSCHWTIDTAGAVVQHAGLDRRCAHAGRVGNRGLGVEIANRGWTRGKPPRATEARSIHGRAPIQAIRYTPEALAAWVALCEWCADRYGWKRQTCTLRRQLTPAELARFGTGALEHLHFSRRKVDGAGYLAEALVAAGWSDFVP